MTPIRVIPSLGPEHWCITSQQKFDKAMSYFFVSERSESLLFKDKVTSLPWIVQSNMGDTEECCNVIQRQLEQYLASAFNNVVVEAAPIPSTDNLRSEIRIYVACDGDDGVSLNLGKILTTENGLIREIADIIAS